MTSHDVVFSLRKIIKDKQVGHIGTLDPMATGLLVCLVGESVKLSDYLMAAEKKYRLTLKLGIETDTWDTTGKVLKTSDKIISDQQIRSEVLNFAGDLKLPIPMYSAKKIDGKKLYDIARKSTAALSNDVGDDGVSEENFEGPEKEMKFWDVQIESIDFPYVTLEFWVSKGSFVRSWAYCLGRKLGTGAALSQLQRLAIGEFTCDQAVTLNDVRSLQNLESLSNQSYFLNSWQALQKRMILELEGLEEERLRTGLVSYSLLNRIKALNLSGIVFCFFSQRLVGILNVSEVIEVKRIFVNSSS